MDTIQLSNVCSGESSPRHRNRVCASYPDHLNNIETVAADAGDRRRSSEGPALAAAPGRHLHGFDIRPSGKAVLLKINQAPVAAASCTHHRFSSMAKSV
jgi:hypothetical protein